VAETNVGAITAVLRLDASAWQQGLQQAQQQLRQFGQQVTQAQQSHSTQQTQAVTQAAREQLQATRLAAQQQMQAIRLSAQEQLQAARLAAQERIAAARQASQAEVLEFRRSTEAARQAFREQREAARQAQQDGRGGGGVLSGALQIAGGIGIATTLTGMISSLRAFGSETVAIGVRLEQLRASLSAIGGSTSAGASAFQFLTQTAQRLGFGLEGLARGYQLLSGATRGTVVAGEQTRQIFDAVATSARAMGASQVQVERALLAIGQIISKGTVQMEELRGQLAEAIPGAVQMTARAFGVTEEALNKMVAAGEVRAIPMIQALTRQMQFELGPAAQQAAQTAGAAFNRLGNEILLARDALTQAFMPALKAAADTASGVLRIFREHREAQALLTEETRRAALIGTQTPLTAQTTQLADELLALRRRQQDVRANIERRQAGGIAGAFAPLEEESQKVLDTLMEQEQALMESMRLISEQTKGQQAYNAAANQARNTREQERTQLEAIKKKLDEINQARQQFEIRATAMPGFYGRPGGTPEEVQRYNQELAQELAKPLGDVGELLGRRTGITPLPVDVEADLQKYVTLHAGVKKAVEESKDAETARQHAAREAAQTTARLTREAAQEQARLAREAQQDAEAYQRAIDQVRESFARQQEQALQTLERMEAAYTQTKEPRDEDTAAALAARFSQNEDIQAAAQRVQALAATRQAYKDEVDALKERFTVLKQNADAQRELEDREEKALERMEENLAALRVPRTQEGFPFGLTREELRLQRQTEGAITTEEGRQRAALIEEAALAQRQLNYAVGLYEEFAGSVASAWTNALQSIASGTQTVGEAFRAMTQAILQSLAQIAAQEGFKALIQFGAQVLTTALGGAAAGGQVGFGAGSGFDPSLRTNVPLVSVRAQHGAIVNRPTTILAGENPAHNPEYLLNRQQMQSLMAAGPSAGGQAANVTVINVASREQAQQTAAQERALGRQVVMNYIMEDLGAGEGSRINSAIRSLQR
jgi:tape measure domain-containing protein